MRLLAAVRRWLQDITDPVCQDRGAVIYGKHRGYLVLLRPVITDGRVSEWAPDLEDAARIDRLIANGELEDLSARDPEDDDDLPQVTQTPALPPALPPVLPPTTAAPAFNPAGIPGL